MKLNETGDFTWIQTFGGTEDEFVTAIRTDGESNIIVAGCFYGHTQLGDSLFYTSHPTGVFLAKYNITGGFEHAVMIDGTNLNAGSGVVYSGEGSVYMAGNFSEEVTFGAQTFVAGEFNMDIYIAKFTAQGNLEWARHGGGNASDDVTAMDADENGNLVMAGHYLSDISFGNVSLTYTLCCGSPEIYIVQFDDKGTAGWGKQISGIRARINDLTCLQDQKLAFAGIFQEEVALDSLKLDATAENNNYFGMLAPDNLTGYPETSLPQSVAVYPNPASGVIYLEKGLRETLSAIRIYDMSGRLAREIRLSGSHKNAVDISGLGKGIYQLVFTGKEGGKLHPEKLTVY
ncbi:MAG: T9SS type A sorting domain-containing protein [Bacteroidales bacterium]|nr:T9SS type A sorting domain-containing protein [Bacteroidales bacterium]